MLNPDDQDDQIHEVPSMWGDTK